MAMGLGGSFDGRRFVRNVCLERYDETVEQPELLLRDFGHDNSCFCLVRSVNLDPKFSPLSAKDGF
jgi:hypothetical protein